MSTCFMSTRLPCLRFCHIYVFTVSTCFSCLCVYYIYVFTISTCLPCLRVSHVYVFTMSTCSPCCNVLHRFGPTPSTAQHTPSSTMNNINKRIEDHKHQTIKNARQPTTNIFTLFHHPDPWAWRILHIRKNLHTTFLLAHVVRSPRHRQNPPDIEPVQDSSYTQKMSFQIAG